MPLSTFGPYWFQNFAAIMVLGQVNSIEEVSGPDSRGVNWGEVCLGSFYVKPNYPGYLEWAPKLGYTYSVFNLVYETNVASCRIWDALGFKRVGRIKDCGNLRSHPDELVDAIIYGRDLGPEGEDFVSEERFDKIHYYLKHGKYPNGADRAEKSRLRSAATHYKLLPAEDGSEGGERLMLKDKEVVSDPQRQYGIARQVHAGQHGGINKTTATIAEKYHWVRIKETVSLVIKNCPDCKDSMRPASTLRSFADNQTHRRDNGNNHTQNPQDQNDLIERLVDFSDLQTPSSTDPMHHSLPSMQSHHHHHQSDMAQLPDLHLPTSPSPFENLPVDPQIMHAHQSHHQHHPASPPHQSFEDQLRHATH
ncbi:MAG: hypothetical protein Q9174_003694, partial [Haloplaca sp. 1 TL-2023]